MKWKIKEKPGDRRVVKVFALFPKELDDGYVVWMEPFYVEEEYIDHLGLFPIWVPKKTMTKETFQSECSSAW